MQILPIASGKGGVGKSLIAANLAIALSQAGKKVILVDLDLGGSNLHVLLGLRLIDKGIGTFLNTSKLKFEDIIIKTGYENLYFVAGDAENPGLANIGAQQKKRLIKRLLALECDFLIADLGAGTSFNVIDYFLMAGSGIVVTTPTLTSTLNAYLFLKTAMFRLLYNILNRTSRSYNYIENLKKKGTSLQKIYFPKLLDKIKKLDKKSYNVFNDKMQIFKPCIILNMLEDPKDAERANKLRRSTREYLGLDLEHLGVIYRDDLQDIALSSRLSIIIYKPNAILSQAIFRIADKLIQNQHEEESLLDITSIDDSYQIAGLEAEVDFQEKIHHIEELLHCGTLTMGDLIEAVKLQHFEINKMKKENQLLKSKLAKAVEKGFIL